MGLTQAQHAGYVAVIVVELLAISYFAYKAYVLRRWIRLDMLFGIIALNAAVPVCRVAIKAYGIDIDAALNDAGVGILWLSGLAVFVLGICEVLFMWLEALNQRAESHHKLLHEFRTVMDALQNGVPDDVVAKNLGVPVDKVQAIVWFAAEVGKLSKNSSTSDGN